MPINTLKFTLPRKIVADALAKCAAIIERRNTIPILDNIMVRCDGTNIVFRAFDLDMCIDVVCVATPDMPTTAGAVTFPGHTVAKFVKTAKCELVEFEESEGTLIIRAGMGRATFQTLSAEDFPHPLGESFRSTAQPFSMPVEEWHTLIHRTQFAISTEETRYYLNGVYIHEAERGYLRFVSTDGHRLANTQTEAELPQGAQAIPNVIFPRQAVATLKKMLPKRGLLGVAITPGNTVVQWDNVVFRTKNIDGSFPDYQRIIPTENNCKAVAPRAELAALLLRILATGEGRVRLVKLAFAEGQLTISVNSSDGSSSESLAVEWHGAPFEIGFNGTYLRDILTAMDGPVVEMEFLDAVSPAVLTDPDAAQTLFVLMPVRI